MTHHTGYRRFKKNPWDLIPDGQRKEPVKPKQFLSNLGKAIRQARRQKRMTQEDVAELAGVNPKHLGEVELGKANPTVVFLLKVSSPLGVEMPDLFIGSQSLQAEDALIHGEIMPLLRKLNKSNLQKLHDVLKLIVEWEK
jgi:transcriptional regulator with XRE-family HTH domain